MAMIGWVRGAATLAGAGVAGLLIWLSTQINGGTTGGYWAVHGILAAAGLTMAVSQLLGGWTKWGRPRVSLGVLLVGFLPTLIAAGWVLLAGQPSANWIQDHVTAWSGHMGIAELVGDLKAFLAVVAFGLGLVFGFVFDTTGSLQPAEPVTETAPVAQKTRADLADTTQMPDGQPPAQPVFPERPREEQPVP
jgi:hypothetical protein